MISARLIGQFTAVALLSAACATPGEVQKIQPGERPTLETDEAGLWMQMDRAETELKSSGRVVADPELNAYVREVLCRIAADYCADVRIYIVHAAEFNASMGPNGVMIVWTGALLRVQNEAQLASVLGHELAHYVDRHALKRWRDTRNTADTATFFTLASGGLFGIVASLAAIDSVMSFSRDQERESDLRGLSMMREAGYDAREAAKVWRQVIEEQKVSDEPKRSIFFATHPAAEEREETLAKLAAETDNTGTTVNRERLIAMTGRYRGEWLRDELRQRDFARFEVVLNQLAEAGGETGEIQYYRGELYRLRDKDGDDPKAVAAYEAAIATGQAPPEAYRALGLMHFTTGDKAAAKAAFENYLAARQDAEDRAMIEHYLKQIQ